MENSRTCEICKVIVHRASFVKHLRRKHRENLKQNETIIPEWLFKEDQAPIKKQFKKRYNPKTFQQLARKNIELSDKELDKK